jgi:hypothetical protein
MQGLFRLTFFFPLLDQAVELARLLPLDHRVPVALHGSSVVRITESDGLVLLLELDGSRNVANVRGKRQSRQITKVNLLPVRDQLPVS